MADPAFQRVLLRRLLSLPAPALRLMAGGGVAYRGGRTLDPRFQYLWKSMGGRASFESLSPQDARDGWASLVAAVGPDPAPDVKRETVLLDGPGGVMPTALHIPADQALDAPVLVFFHDGAGVAGGLEESEGVASRLARSARTVVAVPQYRLAPEHRFPAAFEDAMAAVRWARQAGERYNCAPDSVSVAGLSSGGGLAAAVCLEHRRLDEPQPERQLLVCPLLDVIAEQPSMTSFADAWPLSAPALRWSLRHYLGADTDPSDLRLSPLRATDLSGLAPAVIVTAGFDPLADQGEQYARKLRSAGVGTRFRCYDSLPHDFPQFGGVVSRAAAAWDEIGALLA